MSARNSHEVDPIAEAWEQAKATLARRWGVIFKVSVVGIATVVLSIFTAAPTYRAVATLVVDPTVSEVPVTPDANTTTVVDRTAELRITSSVALLKSASLVRDALETNPQLYHRAADEPTAPTSRLFRYVDLLSGVVSMVRGVPGELYRDLHEVPDASEADYAAGVIMEHLQVKRVPGSSLIEIAYEHHSPRFAAQVVNTLLDYYIAEAGRMPAQEDDAMIFFNQQYALLGERLAAAKDDLRAFHEREGAELLLESDGELRRVLGELRQSRVDGEASLAEILGLSETLDIEMARLSPKRTRDMILERSNAVQSLKSRIVELELERNEMLARYAPASGKILEIDQQLVEARRILATEIAATSESEAVIDPTRQALELDAVKARARKSALISRIAVLVREIERYEGRLDRRDTLALEKRRLEDEVAIAEQAYRVYRRKEEEARFQHALRESHILGVAVAEQAKVPTIPESGRKSLKLLLGAMLSIGLGIVLAFLLDRIDGATPARGGDADDLGDFDDESGFLDYEEDGLAARAGPQPAAAGSAGSGWARATVSTVATLLVVGLMVGSVFMFMAARAPKAVDPQEVAAEREPLQHDLATLAGLIVTRPGTAVAADAAAHEPVRAVVARPVVIAPPVQAPARVAAATIPAAGGPAPVAVQAAAIDVPTRTAAPASPTARAVVPAAPAEPARGAAAVSPEPARRIVVERGMTFYSLVTREYGSYDAAVVERLRSANPQIDDPTQIAVGDVLIFPAPDPRGH